MFRCVSNRFNVDKGTAWRIVRRVINALYEKRGTFIFWPSRQEAEKTMEIIENHYGFPGVIGAIDTWDTYKNYCAKVSQRIICK